MLHAYIPEYDWSIGLKAKKYPRCVLQTCMQQYACTYNDVSVCKYTYTYHVCLRTHTPRHVTWLGLSKNYNPLCNAFFTLEEFVKRSTFSAMAESASPGFCPRLKITLGGAAGRDLAFSFVPAMYPTLLPVADAVRLGAGVLGKG